MSHPQDYDTTRLVLRRTATEDYIPVVDVPTSDEAEAPYKNELVVNSFAPKGGLKSTAGLFMRVGTETRETLDDEIIRIGKVIVTNDGIASTSPKVSYLNSVGGGSLLETGELWFRTSDQAFFVHDGTQYVRVSPISATEEEEGSLRIATQEEVFAGANKKSAVTPGYLEDWRVDKELLSRIRIGRIIYVDQTRGDDSLENDGIDSHYPYLTIERALLQVAITSYRAGVDNDSFQDITIMVGPGDYTIDNRPGLNSLDAVHVHSLNDRGPIAPTSTRSSVIAFNVETRVLTISRSISREVLPNRQIYNSKGASAICVGYVENGIIVRDIKGEWGPGDIIFYSNYSVYNPPSGGLVIPRGCSVIGDDLRKCVIRPRYLGDYQRWVESMGPCTCSSEGLTARFKVTGSCYIANLSFKDHETRTETHHLTTCIAFASNNELTSPEYGYYLKVGTSMGALLVPPLVAAEYQLSPLETNIVTTASSNLQVDDAGFTAVNTVQGASPYISNCSLLSRFGARGMSIDGSLVGGFRSMVAERFTCVSLQVLDIAFNDKPDSPSGKAYKEEWKHSSFEALSGGYAQLVSCFSICSAEHFRVRSGGELSLANCFTNFGEVAFAAYGYSNISLGQDTGFTVTRIIPPKPIQDPIQSVFLGILSSNSSQTKIYATGPINLEAIKPYTVQSGESVFVEGPDGEEYSATIVGTTVLRGVIDNFEVSDVNNTINDNKEALLFAPVYLKRRPDPRPQEDKIYWVEATGATTLNKRSPQINFIMRVNPSQEEVSLTKTLTVGAVRTTASDGSELPSDTFQVALLSADPANESTSQLYPEDNPNNPDDNPTTSLTYKSSYTILLSLGLDNTTVDSLLVPSIDPFNLTGTENEAITLSVDFLRPSTLRAFGTGMEWVGYGNYSSALPTYQTRALTPQQQQRSIKVEMKGGRVYNIGMTQDGEYVFGDRLFDLKTGEERDIGGTGVTSSGQTLATLTITRQLEMLPNSTLMLSSTQILFDSRTILNGLGVSSLSYATTTSPGFIQIAAAGNTTSSVLCATPSHITEYIAATLADTDDLTSSDKAFTPLAASLLPLKDVLKAAVEKRGFVALAPDTDKTSVDLAVTPRGLGIVESTINTTISSLQSNINTLQDVVTGGALSLGSLAIVATNPPFQRLDGASLVQGDLWWKPETEGLKIYVANAWVTVPLGLTEIPPAAGESSVVMLASVAPTTRSDSSTLVNGDMWWNTTTSLLYIRVAGEWVVATSGSGGDISAIYSALDLKANITSPTFSGAPTAPTPTVESNNTRIATTAFVQSLLAAPTSDSIIQVSALNINCSAGNYFTKTISVNSTFTFSNAPGSVAYAFTLRVTHNGGTITWPTSVRWDEGVAPTLSTSKTHFFMFLTETGGSTWFGSALSNYA